MDSDEDFEYLKICLIDCTQYVDLSGNLMPYDDNEEFEYLLSKLPNKNTEIYVHGFNYSRSEDDYMLSLIKGISGNKNIKELTYARMHLTPFSLSWHLKLLETNPDLKIDFVQENLEIYKFLVLQDIKNRCKFNVC